MITTTIIISFHPMFITKVDKSYKVQCFYSEIAKTVTQQLDVKVGKNMEKNVLVVVGDDDLMTGKNRTAGAQHDPTQDEDIHISVPLPECRYQVLTENKDGEPVKFATVGQTVYHQWTCEPEEEETSPFCATIHSCNVREESGKEVQLLDENGCAVDRFLLNNLEYTADLTGGQVSQVFKFADQPSLFFQCQIRLSLKEGGKCKRSSDECPAAARGKRSISQNENEVDVISQRMTVFDIDDPINPKAAKNLGSDALTGTSSGDICISPAAAGAFVALFGTTLIVSLIAVGLLCFRPQTVKFSLRD
ncbi:hypothetical protein WR25_09183 isoform B [Diploscapter pachys]|nr:hypothetical protein WR25_09183 isoform B [Diploscapter pachys]